MKIPPEGITRTSLAVLLKVDRTTANRLLNAIIKRQGLNNGGTREGEAVWIEEEGFSPKAESLEEFKVPICPHCQKMIGERKTGSVYCSPQCQKAAGNKRQKAASRKRKKLRANNPKGGNFPK